MKNWHLRKKVEVKSNKVKGERELSYRMDWLRQLQKPHYWLLALAAALVTLHLTLLAQANDPELLSMSTLFWLAIGSLVWEKRDGLKLESGVFSSFLGVSLIALVLLRSLSPAGYHLRICPFVSLLGLCLLASGMKRLHHYWKELLILGLLVLYPALALLLKSIDLPTLTAQFSTFTLWAAGFGASRQGVSILLPTGRVEVYGSCSGIEGIIQMFNIAVLFLLMVPTYRLQKAICMVAAVLLGFVVNAARVALMAVLVASSRLEAFEYWHGGNGAFIFSMIAVFLFGIFCWLLLRNPQVKSDSGGC